MHGLQFLELRKEVPGRTCVVAVAFQVRYRFALTGNTARALDKRAVPPAPDVPLSILFASTLSLALSSGQRK